MYKVSALAIPLLASACSPMEEWAPPVQAPVAPTGPVAVDPPSAAIRDWSQVPPTRSMTVPSVNEAAARWTLPPSNPWAPYQKATLLMALDSTEKTGLLPDVDQLEVVTSARAAASRVAQTGLPAGTMWVVDLRGPASVAFGATLSSSSVQPVSPVMTFHNWPADNETVPAEETLAALATMRPRLPPAGLSGVPVFMLDAWRLAYRYDQPDDETTDNRYMLTPSDLPDAAVLRARGIDHVLYVVESIEGAQSVEDDLHETFAAYQSNGIRVSIVDLAQLSDAMPREGELLPEREYGQALYIDVDRVTIVSDASFYHRARGGFGGTHVIYGGGHGFGGAYGFVFGGHGGG